MWKQIVLPTTINVRQVYFKAINSIAFHYCKTKTK